MRQALVLAAAYLLGSIPFSYLIVRKVTGLDARYAGNGNLGARNTIRLAGLGPGVAVIALDMAKGAAALCISRLLSTESWVAYAACACAILGHWFPWSMGFRGGIGQAVASGFFAAIWHIPACVGLLLFILLNILGMPFNIAYIVAAAAFLVTGLVTGGDPATAIAFLVAMSALVVRKVAEGPRQHRILEAQRVEAGDGATRTRKE